MQTSQIKPIIQEKNDIDFDKSLNTQLDKLTDQIVNSMISEDKKKVAVVEFPDLRGNVSEFGRYISEELITRLFNTRKFEVIERRLLNKVLDEQKLTVSDLIDPSSIKELGKILGVDAIVTGTITDLGSTLKVNARIISTETGSVIAVAAIEIVQKPSLTKIPNDKQIMEEKTGDTLPSELIIDKKAHHIGDSSDPGWDMYGLYHAEGLVYIRDFVLKIDNVDMIKKVYLSLDVADVNNPTNHIYMNDHYIANIIDYRKITSRKSNYETIKIEFEPKYLNSGENIIKITCQGDDFVFKELKLYLKYISQN